MKASQKAKENPNFANAVINKNEYLMTKSGSSAEAVIPPNDFKNIDLNKAQSKGYSFKAN